MKTHWNWPVWKQLLFICQQMFKHTSVLSLNLSARCCIISKSVRMSWMSIARWGRYAALFLAPARNVISTLSLSERGPIAVQQRLSDSNQSERTTPDCQQTYIRVAAKPSSVINGIYTNIENLVNHYWTSRWTVKKRKFETLKPISNSIQSPTKNLVNYSIKLFLIG